MDLLRARGCGTLLLVATELGEPIYGKLGFRRTAEYVFLRMPRLPLRLAEGVKRLQACDADAVFDLDAYATGEARSALLEPHLAAGWAHVDSGGGVVCNSCWSMARRRRRERRAWRWAARPPGGRSASSHAGQATAVEIRPDSLCRASPLPPESLESFGRLPGQLTGIRRLAAKESQAMESTEASASLPISEAGRLGGVFHSPASVFPDIAANGRWWLAALIVVILSSVAVSLMVNRVGYDRMIRKTIETSQRMQEMPAEQKEKAIEMQRKMMPVMLRIGPVAAVLIGLLVIAGALLFIFNSLLDAGLTYKKVLNICAYGGLPPSVVSTLATVAVLYLKPPDEFDMQNPLAFNGGAFLDPDSTAKWLMSLASSLDLFTFWTIALFAIGFSAVCGAKRMPVSRALMGIGIPWLLWVVVKAGFASIFS
ncbi:MAG: YIP1 family protein [Candidatus Solibacter usitatus]|nr:YIP1 family protein [Candidatus Solibacter usitatus]